jgi:hypothetical protein
VTLVTESTAKLLTKDEARRIAASIVEATGAIAQDLTTTPLLRLPWAEIGVSKSQHYTNEEG